MDAHRRTSTLRRVATMAALAALAIAPGQAEAASKKKAKQPTISSVAPMNVAVGEMLTIKGRNFRVGKGRNSVGFKRDGAPVVFVRSDLSTKRRMTVKVPSKLEKYMANEGTSKIPTRFRLRVLASRFGKSFTARKLSPTIAPAPDPDAPPGPPTAADKDGDCDGDGIVNGKESDSDNDGLGDDDELDYKLDPCDPDSNDDGVGDLQVADCDLDKALNKQDGDDDNDLLDDNFENTITGTNGCSGDSDGDGVEDGYEYRSAVDLNDDEYESPNTVVPYPGKRPYPNPLFADANVDYDGDGLALTHEYELWKVVTPKAQRHFVHPDSAPEASPLLYSDGLQHSLAMRCPAAGAQNPGACADPLDNGQRVPTQPVQSYDKWANFLAWASADGRDPVRLHNWGAWFNNANGNQYFVEGRSNYSIRDVDRNGSLSFSEEFALDHDGDGFMSDDERDEDADGLTNFDELRSRMQPEYWAGCYEKESPYPVAYAGTSMLDGDSDGDGIRDGADDQDHDDIPNMMELSRLDASHFFDGKGICTPRDDLKEDEPLHHDNGVIIGGYEGHAYGFVNPFNPCLPDHESRTCSHVLGDPVHAPFAGPHWWSLQ